MDPIVDSFVRELYPQMYTTTQETPVLPSPEDETPFSSACTVLQWRIQSNHEGGYTEKFMRLLSQKLGITKEEVMAEHINNVMREVTDMLISSWDETPAPRCKLPTITDPLRDRRVIQALSMHAAKGQKEPLYVMATKTNKQLNPGKLAAVRALKESLEQQF